MTKQVAELEGAELDYFVAKALGMPVDEKDPQKPYALGVVTNDRGVVPFAPSRDWALGGPIIERERITIQAMDYMERTDWQASKDRFLRTVFDGTTPLIAAMRALVASRFGDEVPDITGGGG